MPMVAPSLRNHCTLTSLGGYLPLHPLLLLSSSFPAVQITWKQLLWTLRQGKVLVCGNVPYGNKLSPNPDEWLLSYEENVQRFLRGIPSLPLLLSSMFHSLHVSIAQKLRHVDVLTVTSELSDDLLARYDCILFFSNGPYVAEEVHHATGKSLKTALDAHHGKDPSSSMLWLSPE